MLLLLEAQEGNWDEIDLMVRALPGGDQRAALREGARRRRAGRASTLGGGCEVALHGDRVQAAAETYIGLVEVGVGLIPAGGGTKEMLARAVEALGAAGRPAARHASVCSRRSASRRSPPARPTRRAIGYLRDVDGDLDESRAPAVGRQAEGAGPRARGLPAAAPARRDSRRRRGRARGARARRAPGVAGRAHQRPRRAHRPQARRTSSAAARCRTPRR